MVLQPLTKENQIYLIGNTHLNFNANRGDIKLAEIKIFTDALGQLKEHYQNLEKKKVVTIVCGDFNSVPKSGIYEFMRSGSFDVLKLSRYDISGQNKATLGPKDFPSSFAMTASSLALDA